LLHLMDANQLNTLKLKKASLIGWKAVELPFKISGTL